MNFSVHKYLCVCVCGFSPHLLKINYFIKCNRFNSKFIIDDIVHICMGTHVVCVCIYVYLICGICGSIHIDTKALGKRAYCKIFHTSLIITSGNMMSVELCIFAYTLTEWVKDKPSVKIHLPLSFWHRQSQVFTCACVRIDKQMFLNICMHTYL